MIDREESGIAGHGAPRRAPWPVLSSDVPPVAGRLKEQVEDFVVEEIPAYLPCGEGEHLFLWIEKRDVSVDFLKRHLVRTLELAPRDLGMAGIKDRRAVTRQWISVPRHVEAKVDRIDTDSIRLLDARPHRNKLKTSHLKGNRFSILLRAERSAEASERIERVAWVLRTLGVPNYYGTQRFGRHGATVADGLRLLRGERLRGGRLPGWKRRFLLSAVQSWLFNESLAERLREGTLHRVLPGDVMQVRASGGLFVCEDTATDQARLDRREIVPTGPLFGPKMRSAAGRVREAEEALLRSAGIDRASFERHKKLVPGARRPHLIWPERLDVIPQAEGWRFELTLPAGSYATVAIREFTKEEFAAPDLP